MAKYSMVEIYTKKGNLDAYLYTDKIFSGQFKGNVTERTREYYTKEREIQLVAKFRFENGKMFCKINCPVNPLPVKGEFEIPSMSALNVFFKRNGWEFKQKLYSHIFD